MSCRFRFCFHEIDVVVSIYGSILRMADVTDRLIYAGGCASDMIVANYGSVICNINIAR